MLAELDDLLNALSLEEKISLLSGQDLWHTRGLPAHGVPALVLTDGPHGVRLARGALETFGAQGPTGATIDDLLQPLPSTVFPCAAALASTWNEALIERVGRAMAEECRHYQVDVILGPGVNGKRSPLGGRNFEYYSEDPVLSGRIGAALVRGVQSGGVGTSLKHFVANEQETNRTVVSAEVDERALREIYLLPFETIVREAQPWTVMAAHNRLNGTPMWANGPLLRDILKREWGFAGVVVSDWSAVTDKVRAIQGGLDLEMPGPGTDATALRAAIRAGTIPQEMLDEAVRRVLKLAQKAEAGRRLDSTCDFQAHHELAGQVAAEAVVLLRNDRQLLPLKSGRPILVVGPGAVTPVFQGGGSSRLNPRQLDAALDGLRLLAPVLYCEGYGGPDQARQRSEACALAIGQSAVVVFVQLPEGAESEGYDRTSIDLPVEQVELIRALASVNPAVVVVVAHGSALRLREVEPSARAILWTWLAGEAGGTAIAQILFGQVNPSGKLAETLPLELAHNPSFLAFPGTTDRVVYEEGVFVGYRYYDVKKLEVQYPFGHGLSYTRFEYDDLRVSQSNLRNGDTLSLQVSLRNTGLREGQEVVQVYVRDCESSLRRPDQELKAFAKVRLQAGESRELVFDLGERAFAHYVPHLRRFAVESGDFEIRVGASSRDIRLQQVVTFDSLDLTAPPLRADNAVKLWLRDARIGARLHALLAEAGLTEAMSEYQLLVSIPLARLPEIFTMMGLPTTALESLLSDVRTGPA